MSFNRDHYDPRRRTVGTSHRTPLGYWVPLLVTVTAATVGIAAWIWSERRDSQDDDDNQRTRRNRRSSSPPPSFRDEPQPTGEASHGEERIGMHNQEQEEDAEYGRREGQGESQEGMMARIGGVIRRAPSPQQMFDSASKRVVAGVAAAGTVVGRGLGAIREQTPKDDFADHERWSEEVEQREQQNGGRMDAETEAAAAREALVPSRMLKGGRGQGQGQGQSRGKRKMVAVVVSADGGGAGHIPDEEDATYQVEHASILSHIPSDIDPATTQLLIIIYAPHLHSHPLSTTTEPQADASTTSSYINISHPTVNPPNALYSAIQSRALHLVSSPTHILPFTTPTGHIHLLRHLSPSLVYIQESLCGSKGEYVSQVEGWVGQVVVVLGEGGLVDTETEDEGAVEDGGRYGKWWMDEGRVGLGKGVEVVDGMRLGEDWGKRVRS